MSAEEIVRALATVGDPMRDDWCVLCEPVMALTDHAGGCPWRMARDWVEQEGYVDMEEAERATRRTRRLHDDP